MIKHFLFSILLLATALSATFAQAHRWPLTTNLADTIGTLDGTNHGVTFELDPVRGSVAVFNGSGYLNLPSFINGKSELSLAIWYRMDVPIVWARVYTFGNGDQVEPKDIMHFVPINGCCAPEENWYLFTLSNPGLPWYDFNVDTAVVNLQTGVWHHHAVVFKSDSVLIYHDGERVRAAGGIARDIATLVDTSNALGKSFWPDLLWVGAMSDLRVYDEPLTDEEIADIFTGETTSNLKDQSLTLTPNLYTNGSFIHVDLRRPVTDEKVTVYNLMGTLVADKRLSSQEELRVAQSGMYVVKIEGSHTQYAKLIRVIVE